MKTKTAEDFQRQVKEKNIVSWVLRHCSICDAPLAFLFDDDDVFYDANCDCTTYETLPERRTYQDVADIYNRNIIYEKFVRDANEHFGFKD
jgi:hypothetical protein